MRVCIVVALLMTSASARAQEAITLGYITGNDYLEMPESGRLGWLIGAFDGLMAEEVAASKNPNGPWLGRCLKGVPARQAAAIFDKYLGERPESWHVPAAFVVRDSMLAFCKGRQ